MLQNHFFRRFFMAGKFELKKTAEDSFMFNLKASNGKIILTSQRYQSKAAAQGGIESVKRHAGDDANYERKTAANGEAYFVLKAANQQVIGNSEMYTTTAARENGIASVTANAPDADVEDLTA
jgi:uncharacterized protein